MDEFPPSFRTSLCGWLSPAVLFVLLNLVIRTIAVTSKSLLSRRGARRSPSVHQPGEHFQPENESPPFSRQPSSTLELLRSFSFFRSGDDFSVLDDSVAPSYADVTSQGVHAPRISRGPSSVLESLHSFGLHRLRSGAYCDDDDAPSSSAPPSKIAAPSPNPSPPISRGTSFVLDRLHSIGLRRLRSGDIPEDAAPSSEQDATSQRTGDIGFNPHYDRSMSDSEEVAGGNQLPGKMNKYSASAGSAFAHFSKSDVTARLPEEHEVDARAEDFISRFKQQLKLQRLDSIVRYKEMLSGGRQN